MTYDYCYKGYVFVRFWAVPSVVERGRAGENVRRNARPAARQKRSGHRKGSGTSRLHKGGCQGNVPDESDIGGHRQSVAGGVRVLRIQSAGWSKCTANQRLSRRRFRINETRNICHCFIARNPLYDSQANRYPWPLFRDGFKRL